MDTKTSTPKWFRRLLAAMDNAPLIAVSPVFPGIHPAVPAWVLEDEVEKRRTKDERAIGPVG